MDFDIQHYETNVELVDYIPVDKIFPYRRFKLYSLDIESIKKDSILNVTSQFEVTNDTSLNLMVGSVVEFCDVYEVCLEITKPVAFNITPAMHHGVITHNRNYKFDQDYTKGNLNIMVWSASSRANEDTQLKIEQDYGHLDAVIVSKSEGFR
jgi:hypothetical protein